MSPKQRILNTSLFASETELLLLSKIQRLKDKFGKLSATARSQLVAYECTEQVRSQYCMVSIQPGAVFPKTESAVIKKIAVHRAVGLTRFSLCFFFRNVSFELLLLLSRVRQGEATRAVCFTVYNYVICLGHATWRHGRGWVNNP